MSLRLGCLLALGLGLFACAARRDGGAAAGDRSPVVARVEGEAVTAREVELAARAEHLSPRDALARCVRDRLLVREAMRRGIIDDDDVENARWHARVQGILAREVEDRESAATIPGDFFEAFYQRRRVEFSHDGLVEVVHALAAAGDDAGVGARDAATAQMRGFYATLAATGRPPTRAEFEALGRQMRLHVEPLQPFDRTGQAADGTTYVAPFTRAAWGLTEAAPLSAPFVTSFGVHVALRVGYVAPLARPPAEVRAVIVRDGVNVRRAQALRGLIERLRARADIRVSETTLGSTAGGASR